MPTKTKETPLSEINARLTEAGIPSANSIFQRVELALEKLFTVENLAKSRFYEIENLKDEVKRLKQKASTRVISRIKKSVKRT